MATVKLLAVTTARWFGTPRTDRIMVSPPIPTRNPARYTTPTIRAVVRWGASGQTSYAL